MSALTVTGASSDEKAARSVPGLLVALAEACTTRGLPVPGQVIVNRGNEIVSLVFRDGPAFERWLAELGVPFDRSQPFDEDGQPMRLRSAHGDWLGWWVALTCVVPADPVGACL